MLNGTIENIMPAVSQGMMECLIRIDSGDISMLRPAQQLEIRVIISIQDNVLRIPNGPYYKDRGYKEMYVIDGKRRTGERFCLAMQISILWRCWRESSRGRK